ncbi:microtubule-associated protein RP/EB family member 1-like [Papaver somniferum]|uniref:microtubule-associated protein RP/EB family member 1-like n=1 Tax=Papaver somniferum TaxID=3469 RepID=UPI000E6FA4B6|nr:microtubule-associated protein RP/EB family member 1-like [Papaver somniferum]
MVELISGSTANSENTKKESVPGISVTPSSITTQPTDPSSVERAPSIVTPPITRDRSAAASNVPAQLVNPGSSKSAPSGVTPPVSRARAAATSPNVSSSMAPPTTTNSPIPSPTGRETGGTRGNRPYVTIADLMERQEVLSRAQMDMVSTQKEVLVFPVTMRNTSNTPGTSTSVERVPMDEDIGVGTPS